jgi:hypothetical protein
MRQDRQGLALSRFLRQAREVFLARRVVTEEQDGGFGEGPREVGLADLLAGGAVAFAGGVFGALDEAARGDTCLPPWETAAVMALIPQPEREDFAAAWDRAQPVEGLCIMFLCRPHEIPLEVSQPAVVSIKQGEVQVDARLDSRIGKSCRHPLPVRFVGERCADLREVVLTVGLLDMSPSLGPVAHEMPPPPT